MELSLDNRIAGVLAPLFAIRSEDDLGIGDVASLRQFIDWSLENGFHLVQLLPINETGGENSPYMAVSSHALDPTTIETTPRAIPDLTENDHAKVLSDFDLRMMRKGPVQYARVKALKHALLEKAFTHFEKSKGSRAKEFTAFSKAQVEWLRDYTIFRVLMEANGCEEWDRWPKEQSTAKKAWDWLSIQSPARRKALERRMKYFAYVQWIAYSQWRDLKAYCDRKGVALMGDVPIGVSYYSADVFSLPQIFDLTWSGGAPPERVFKSDPFTEKWGQNWGVPKYRWDVMRTNDFEWWRHRVQGVREIFHLFRIDHVLGFYRFYSFPWRPEKNSEFLPLSEEQACARTNGRLPQFLPRDDNTWENKDANRREGEEYLRRLLAVVGEHRLIGEDLGVVPDYVQPSLTSLGIAGFKVPQWEKGPDGRLIDGARYQRLAVTTYATHDHEPLKVQWTKWYQTAVKAHHATPELDELRRLAEFAKISAPMPRPWSQELHEALLRALFASNAWIAVGMITDLLSSEQRFNVPGTIAESNWAERLPLTVAQMRKDADVCTKMKKIREMLVATGRVPSKPSQTAS
jgi:4-alpha-glucanotransferase